MTASEQVLIYKVDGSSFYANRSDCYFTDRSRINDRKKCPYLSFASHHALGRGVGPLRESEDLVLGSATHNGMETLFFDTLHLGESGGHSGDYAEVIRDSARKARDYMLSKGERVDIQGDRHIWDVNPETAQLLLEEQAHIAQGLVYAFGERKLDDVLARYEIVSLEEEVNWLLGVAEDGRWIVMMSRWDAVWRDGDDGKLYPVSYKTLKDLDKEVQKKWESDSQRFTEGLAMQARFGGEEPGGILYWWFIKGRKDAYGEEVGYKRYKNGLVRPYANMDLLNQGSPAPHMFKFAGEWWDPRDEKTHKIAWKTYKRVDIWREMDFEEWLGWLRDDLIEPELGIDYLGKAVATEAIPVPWVPSQAQRWMDSQQLLERNWIHTLSCVDERPELVDTYISRTDTACVDFKRPCRFHSTCWGPQYTLEQMLDAGEMVPRIQNHLQEFGEED